MYIYSYIHIYVYIKNWVTLLYSRKWQNSINQLLQKKFLIKEASKKNKAKCLKCYSIFFKWMTMDFILLLWLHLWHMEVSGPGIESEPQLWQYQTLQRTVLGQGWACTSAATQAATVRFLTHWATAATPTVPFLQKINSDRNSYCVCVCVYRIGIQPAYTHRVTLDVSASVYSDWSILCIMFATYFKHIIA